MKIAFVSQPWEALTLPVDGSSSIATVTYQLARRLAARGDEVVVYARRERGQAVEERDDAGVTYRRVAARLEDDLLKPFKLAERLTGLGEPGRPVFASALAYRAYAVQVARDLRRRGCDVVHVHNFSQFAPVIRRYNPGVRIALHMHCDWLAQLDRKTVARRLRDVDLVVGTSDHVTRGVQARFPEYADRCRTISNSIDAGRFSAGEHSEAKTPSEPRILYVGRVSPEKGVHVLLDAFEVVARRWPGARLDVVGAPGLLAYEMLVGLSDDPVMAGLRPFYGQTFKDRLKRRVLGQGGAYLDDLRARLTGAAAGRVRFHGFVPHDRLAACYRAADVFVFPSVCHEAFGLPVAEAMACEVPVVATRSGGVAEVVEDGRTGLLVPRGDAGALADALLRLLADADLRRRLGQAGRARVLRRYAWDDVADALRDAYVDAGAPAGAPTPAVPEAA